MIIPNMSTELRERVRREAYLTNEIIIRTELLKAKGELHLNRELSKRELEFDEYFARAIIVTIYFFFSSDLHPDDTSKEANESGGPSSPNFLLPGGENNPCLRQRRTETGDITDGKIIV